MTEIAPFDFEAGAICAPAMDRETCVTGSDPAGAGLPSCDASARARRRREPIGGGQQCMDNPDPGLGEGEGQELTDERAEALLAQKIDALESFEIALRNAGDAMAIAAPGEEERAAALAALGAVVAFLAGSRSDMSAQGAIFALASALEGLDTGKGHPMLEPVKSGRSGSRGVPTSVWVRRAIPAAALELKLREGESLDAAARWVARRAAAWRIWSPGKGSRSEKLKDWREEMRTRARGDLAKAVYDHYAAPARFSAKTVLGQAGPRFGLARARPGKSEKPGD